MYNNHRSHIEAKNRRPQRWLPMVLFSQHAAKHVQLVPSPSGTSGSESAVSKGVTANYAMLAELNIHRTTYLADSKLILLWWRIIMKMTWKTISTVVCCSVAVLSMGCQDITEATCSLESKYGQCELHRRPRPNRSLPMVAECVHRWRNIPLQ